MTEKDFLSEEEETEMLEDEFEQQIKSRDRVKDHGEVFTNKREVNAMLDLVEDESYKVDSRFLEPACGTGNFLVEIIDRKMKTVLKKHNADQVNFEINTFIAVASIYAIDIQEDNCEESRERVFNIVKDYYLKAYPATQNERFLNVINHLLELNIILGNGLTGLQVDKDNLDGYADRPIVFSEFTAEGLNVTRKDFKMNDIIEHNKNIEKRKSKAEGTKKNKAVIESDGIFNFGVISPAEENVEVKADSTLKPIKEFGSVDFKSIDKLEY